MESLTERLKADFRMVEGLKACINCGTCAAICPAATVSDYDPRIVVDLVQQHNEHTLRELLSSDMIWKCGECLSCKTRCPRENVPGYIIQALRSLSIETGLFMESEQGRKQLALKRTIGEHILEYGYCVYIDKVNTDMYPEQGPVWDWYHRNREQVLERLGASYGKESSGALRKIPEESMTSLRKIFEETGAIRRFEAMEEYGHTYSLEHGIDFGSGQNDAYFKSLYES